MAIRNEWQPQALLRRLLHVVAVVLALQISEVAEAVEASGN